MPKIEIRSLSKSFPGPVNHGRVHALRDVDLTIERGDFFVILGPSGCGKSSLLNVVAGLAEADGGEVLIDGERVGRPNPQKVAMMFQEAVLYPWRTVLRNVEFGLERRKISAEERRVRALKYLRIVGLESFAGAYPRQLSGGMSQRVALCRALAMETEIILMDEPFGALDEQTRILLGQELVEIWSQVGKTIVFVTHSITEAISLGEHVAIFTARPGSVKRIVPVNFPRPRKSGSPEFQNLVELLWTELREESMKAIGRENLS
ncbi:MAG: ABC transporter ATP-binding protein [Deltaproteobacteria bacterium]|nr:ABC transporter ATP-binding protein [Deltaproteobacteria bacterium]